MFLWKDRRRLVSSSTCSARIVVRLQPRSQAFYKAGTSHTDRPVATRNQASLTKSAKNCDDKITQSAHLCNPYLVMVGYTLLNLCNSAITIISSYLSNSELCWWSAERWHDHDCISTVLVSSLSSWSKWACQIRIPSTITALYHSSCEWRQCLPGVYRGGDNGLRTKECDSHTHTLFVLYNDRQRFHFVNIWKSNTQIDPAKKVVQGSLNRLVVWLRNSKTQLSSINPSQFHLASKS